jgi:hypothetical protein
LNGGLSKCVLWSEISAKWPQEAGIQNIDPILRSTNAFGRSALSGDDLTNRTGFDQFEKAPNIAATIRITTISQKIAETNTAMLQNAAELILGRCSFARGLLDVVILVRKKSSVSEPFIGIAQCPVLRL